MSCQSRSYRAPHLEGPAVVPASFGPFGGQILVADDVNGEVHAIENNGTVTLNVFNWTLPDWAGAESVQVIPSESVRSAARAAPTSRRYSTLTRSSNIR